MIDNNEVVTILKLNGVYSLYIKTLEFYASKGCEEVIINRRLRLGKDITRQNILSNVLKKLITTQGSKNNTEYSVNVYMPITICSLIRKDTFELVEDIVLEDVNNFDVVITFEIIVRGIEFVYLSSMEHKVSAEIMHFLYWGINKDSSYVIST
jgi:hypothetical protein